MNNTVSFENSASRTLLIPLAARAQESMNAQGLFTDKVAENIVAALPDELFSFTMNAFMRIGTAVRVKYFDDKTKEALTRSAEPVIVHLGCGLDTRFSRTDFGKGIQINIDLPEVMALRKRILPDFGDRCQDWEGSLLERDWMDRLAAEYSGSQFTFTIEGVLMYLEEQDVQRFFTDLAERFPGSHIVFDTAGTFVSRMLNKKSAVSELSATIVWGYDDDGSLDAWHPRLRRIERAYYFNREKKRWGLRRFVHYMPKMGKGSAMFHYSIDN